MTDIADREMHERMGFHVGWGFCADQLAAPAATLQPFFRPANAGIQHYAR